MKFGMITLAAVSCRAEASHKSEQINQLLFGDLYTIRDEATDWFKISSAYDNYEGWIHKKHHTSITQKQFRELKKQTADVTLDLVSSVKEKKTGNSVNIPIGSSLRKGIGFKHKGKISRLHRSNIYKYALLYLNSPYLWGGRTPFGIDCSGFMQMSHKLAGIQLPRDSWQQALVGKKIAKFSSAKKGDLCFFGDDKKVTHVGLLLGKNKIIHASGKVRIDTIDKKGIFNEELKTYTHRLKSTRRI